MHLDLGLSLDARFLALLPLLLEECLLALNLIDLPEDFLIALALLFLLLLRLDQLLQLLQLVLLSFLHFTHHLHQDDEDDEEDGEVEPFVIARAQSNRCILRYRSFRHDRLTRVFILLKQH